jgi:hypothetical protein
MTAFTPKREDGRALWQVVFDAVHADPPNTTYTYAEIGSLIETDVRHDIYSAVGRCNRELWKRAQRSLQNVRGIGYRMLKPQEHEVQALDYQDRGRRKMKNAIAIMRATDLTALSDPERTHVLQVESVLVAMGRAVDHAMQRLSRHDDILRELAQRVDALEERS